MKNLIIGAMLPLSLILGIGLNAHATEIPQGLSGVKNISHPASNRYGAGQPTAAEFAAFAKAGVKHVINLRPPGETPELNQAAMVTKAGMAYYNVPIAGGKDLTRDNVALIDKLLRQIGDEPVLVHCASSNRVGAIMALRAAWIDNVSKDQAIALGERWGLTRLQPNVERLLQK